MTSAEQTARERDPISRRVLLANPRGFCAGVIRAIEAVERALALFGAPVYVRRPIVHNRAVVTRLQAMGAIFVQEVEDAPKGSVLVLSAHGVAPAIARSAEARGLKVIDATCPLVAKVHADVVAHHRSGRLVLLIGHRDHPEIIGTLGQVPDNAAVVVACPEDIAQLELPDDANIAYAVQTTFAVLEAQDIVDAIKARFWDVASPRSGNICYATTNRQAAVEALAPESDYFLVVGDTLSSNAKRLVEVAMAAGCPGAALVAEPQDLDWVAVDRAQTIGLSAGASTPDSSVGAICQALAERGFSLVEYEGDREAVSFKPLIIEPG